MKRTCGFLIVAIAALMGCKSAGTDNKPTKEWTSMEYTWAPHLQPRARNLVPTQIPTENVVIRGATILTATGERIEDGSIWLKDGKIAALGSAVEAPGAIVVEAHGKFVTPGLIDTHSHLGVYPTPGDVAHSDGNEATSPTTPQVDALDSVWPQDPGFQTALKGGVTILQTLPGSANLVGGSTATLQLHPGVTSRAMVVPEAPRGIKMACGENPKRVYGGKGGMPSTRMGNMAVWRATFEKARDYRKSLVEHEEAMKRWMASDDQKPETKPKPPSRDHAMETLAAVLDGKTLVHVHCYRADEMVQVLQLAEEFGFHVRSFHHAVEAYKIRDILAEWNVSVSTWADWWGFKLEAHDAIRQNAALLTQAGAIAIIHSDSALGIQRLNQEAAKALYAGQQSGVNVTEEDALRWITANAAWALGLHEVTGTLEVGKRADVVVWSEHPFSIYSRAEQVWVEGVREWDITRGDEPWSDFQVGQ